MTLVKFSFSFIVVRFFYNFFIILDSLKLSYLKKIFVIVIFFNSLISIAQSPRWISIASFPPGTARKDDHCFINSNTGWVVDAAGYVYKTTDGSHTWQRNFLISYWLRCIGFTDSLNGFIGVYDVPTGTSPLFRTTNGGENWFRYTNIPDPKPRGLCGISCVDKNVIYCVGRIEGPATVMKSTNGGDTWFYLNTDSLATCLVDVYFTSSDSGFITGGKQFHPTILFTSNGGQNWTTRYLSASPSSYGAIWKIQFVNKNIGTASFNQQSSSLQFIKTTDGGQSWNLFTQIVNPETFTQGIGFKDENTGWLGGGANTYETTNGGLNWNVNNFGTSINRIRFYSDTLAYASGIGFYKYTSEKNIGINNLSSSVTKDFVVYQNYPNPFNPSTIINYEIIKGTSVKIKIYNAAGRLVKTLLDSRESAGPHQIGWDGTDNAGNYSPSGIYYYVLEAGNNLESRKMVLMR